MKLEIRNLNKAYVKDRLVLQDFNYAFVPGIHGLLGPNGAGKSTLMKIIVQILDKTSGSILFNEKEVDSSFLKHIGYMPQHFCLYDDFTLRENLNYISALKGIMKNEIQGQIIRVSKNVDLYENLDDKLSTFSGGMKQRAMFAQALLGDPDILVLDEPTAGLDPQKRIELRNLIAKVGHQKIVLIATHVVSDIDVIADQILLIKGGRCIKSGSIRSLTDSIYGSVYTKKIERNELEDYEDKYKISNLSYIKDELMIRYIAKESHEGMTVYPDLEEVYLYYCGDAYGKK